MKERLWSCGMVNAGVDATEDALLCYEVLMHLLQTQSAEQMSLEKLYRLRRAQQKSTRYPASAGARSAQQGSATAATRLDELCPLEAERLQGGSLCIIWMDVRYLHHSWACNFQLWQTSSCLQCRYALSCNVRPATCRRCDTNKFKG